MKVTHIAGAKRTVGEVMRVERHCANALAVARYLEGVPCVKRVRYPGLESSPYHELVKTQMNGRLLLGSRTCFACCDALLQTKKL